MLLSPVNEGRWVEREILRTISRISAFSRKTIPLFLRASTFPGLVTTPPPQSITVLSRAQTSATTRDSRSLKYSQECCLTISGIPNPACLVISASVSTLLKFSCSATSLPTVLFPVPRYPIKTKFIYDNPIIQERNRLSSGIFWFLPVMWAIFPVYTAHFPGP